MSTEITFEGHDSIRNGACHVIAEAGANHNNSIDRAIEMAQEAHKAGAWAIKYQLYRAETLSVRNSPKYWTDEIGTSTQYEAFKLSDKVPYSDYHHISQACEDLGILFFATPFDLPAVDALEDMRAPLYKIASADITYKQLLQRVGETGKPVLLSTGAADVEEIRQALDWLGADPTKVVLLMCTLTYPTPDPDGNFARLETFRREFDPYLSGTSDHTLGPEGAWMTAALGGVCIEKHYTLDKKLPDVPDHAMSVNPDELRVMVEACRRGSVLRGSAEIGTRESERPARDMARRSVVTEGAIAAGTSVTAEMLGAKRPGTGLPPRQLDEVVGRVTARDLPEGTILDWADLE